MDERVQKPSGARALWRPAAVVALAVATLVMCGVTPPDTERSGAGVTLSLPAELPGYFVQPEKITEAELAQLPKDTEFDRKSYTRPDGTRIVSSIILSGADRRSIHRPEICLPGQGWTIVGGAVDKARLRSGRDLEFMKLTLKRPVRTASGEQRILESYYLYWFVGKNTDTPHHWRRMVLTSWDLAFRNIMHRWAYIIVNAPIASSVTPGGMDAASTLEMLRGFIRDAVPYFQIIEKETGL